MDLAGNGQAKAPRVEEVKAAAEKVKEEEAKEVADAEYEALVAHLKQQSEEDTSSCGRLPLPSN